MPTFAIPPMKNQPDPSHPLLRLLAAWGLIGPAWIFLETLRPLAFLGEQAFLLVQPLLPDPGEIPFLSDWTGFLAGPAGLEGQPDYLEPDLSEERSWT